MEEVFEGPLLAGSGNPYSRTPRQLESDVQITQFCRSLLSITAATGLRTMNPS